MSQSVAPQKKNVSVKFKETCHYVTTFGMRIGNVPNVVRETDVIIM